jgi:two-component system chemotaxis sensor kinase CheA
MNELDQLIKEFLVESYENLDQLDRDLVELEKDPTDKARLSSIFRTIHTIKGTCGFFGFSKLESVTHVGENLLSRLRDGILILDPERTSILLTMLDAVRSMLAKIESTGNDGDEDYSDLIERLTKLQEVNPVHSSLDHPKSNQITQQAQTQQLNETKTTETSSAKSSQLQLHSKESSSTIPEVQENHKVEEETRPEVDAFAEKNSNQPIETRELITPATQESKTVAVAETNIRVDVGLLDKLMNLVGELVLTRNQILQFNVTQKDPAFLSTTQRLNLITTELQEGVMKTRMQPIGNIWNRFPRVVRDLALSCGKEVQLEMEGKETELDKTIIEAIKDPLTHIIRNSVDHGIERPEVRRERGKPQAGRLLLRAFHEGGQVNIEIIDDGAGVNPEKVKAKAVEKGLISKDQASRMTDREAIQLLFLPGFSTAEKITNVSGRGVGMDVVRTNIEKIGGTVDLQSKQGEGTTIKIKIPLTLAIIPALIVSSGKDRFAIPQVSLLELVRLDGEQARNGVEKIHGAPVYRLRGNLLPLVYLNRELTPDRTMVNSDSDTINIVVLQADDRQFGLVVEGINDTEEIVVKPLGKQLKNIPIFAGATIMGDGKVALILDVMGIAQRAGVIAELKDRSISEIAKSSHENDDQKQTLLLVGMNQERRAAIPLSVVARLEEISVNKIERTEDQEVVQYRGQIMPLIRLMDFIGVHTDCSDRDTMQVVVYSNEGRSVGLVVDKILDIVETTIDVKRPINRRGIVASVVIQQKVTDLLDIQEIIRSADPNFFENAI